MSDPVVDKSNPNSYPARGKKFGEIIKGLIDGTLGGTEGGNIVAFINETPDIDSKTALTKDGEFVHGFGDKFVKGFTGWRPGDLLRTTCKMVYKTDDEGNKEPFLQVSDSVVGDIRHADSFRLRGLSPEDIEAFSLVGAAEVEVTLKISNRINEDFQLSDMQEYEAELKNVVAIQQVWDGDFDKLEPEKPVLVEGQVVEYKPDYEYPHTNALTKVRLKNGLEVEISLWNGFLDITGGVLKIMDPKHPVPGDIVQINSVYGNPVRRYEEESPNVLYAHCNRSTYLLKPDEKRAGAYEFDRHLFATEIEKLSKVEDPREIRQGVSVLIKKLTGRGGESKFTVAEKLTVKKLIEDKIVDPEERPVDFFDDEYGVREFEKVYGRDIVSMDRNELYQFCIGVAEGNQAMVGDGSSDIAWRVMESTLSEEQKRRVLLMAVEHIYPRVIDKVTIRREDLLVDRRDIPDFHERSYGLRIGKTMVVVGKKPYPPDKLQDPRFVTWEMEYLFSQTLNYMSSLVNIDVAKTYIQLAKNMLNGSLFLQEGGDTRKEYFEYDILDRMKTNIMENVVWKDGKWGTEVVGLKDVEVANMYVEEAEEIAKLKLELEEKGWTNNGARDPKKHAEGVLGAIKLIHEYLWLSGQLKEKDK